MKYFSEEQIASYKDIQTKTQSERVIGPFFPTIATKVEKLQSQLIAFRNSL